MTRTILACGSRHWRNREVVWGAILDLGRELGFDLDSDWTQLRLIHGGARGADHYAATCATKLGMTVEAYPADWERHGKRAGPLRNIAMLDQRPDVVLAFWNGYSPGTAHTIGEARRRGIDVRVVAP